MSEVRRCSTDSALAYPPIAGEREVIDATDHDAKVAALEAEIERLQIHFDAMQIQRNHHRDTAKALAAELAALKGAAGEDPEVVGTRYSSVSATGRKISLVRLSKVKRDGWQLDDLMTIAQHQRIAAAMARDADGLVEALERVMFANEVGYLPNDVQDAVSSALAAHRAGKERPEQPPANCRQRLVKEGKPYPRSSCQACGKFSPKWKECEAALSRQQNHDAPL